MSWKKEVQEIDRRRAMAQEMGGSANVERHHQAGKLTARERIARLVDPGSFREYGALTGQAAYDENGNLKKVVPANVVIGTGLLKGRRAVVSAEDFTVRGGSSEATRSEKWIWAETYAQEMGLPLVRLVDTAGGSVKLLESMGATKLPGYPTWHPSGLLGRVPVVAVALGSVAGLGAFRVVAAHFSIMVKGTSQVFAAGPPLVTPATGEKLNKEELGGYRIHTRGSGVVDNEAESEEQAFEQVRIISPFCLQRSPAAALPRLRRRPGPQGGGAALPGATGPAQKPTTPGWRPADLRPGFSVRDRQVPGPLGHRPAGPPGRLSGGNHGQRPPPSGRGHGPHRRGKDHPLRGHVRHLPSAHRQPGGPARGGHRPGRGTGRDHPPGHPGPPGHRPEPGALGRGDHAPGLRCGRIRLRPPGRINLRFAWPSARWGSLPIEGGVAAAYKRELAQAEDPEARERELEEHYDHLQSPFRTAERFGVTDIIDPRETRPILCDWVEQAYRVLPQQLGLTYGPCGSEQRSVSSFGRAQGTTGKGLPEQPAPAPLLPDRGSIRERILRGEWPPESKLPTEGQLSKQYQVSRQTIRKAKEDLIRDGLVRGLQGSGSYINPREKWNTRPPTVENLKEFFTFALTTSFKIHNYGMVANTPEVSRRLRNDRDKFVFQIRGCGFRRANPCPTWSTTCPPSSRPGFPWPGWTKKPLSPSSKTGRDQDHGGHPVHLLGRADHHAAEHLDLEPGDPVLVVETIYSDERDRPIEFVRSQYREGLPYSIRVKRD